MQKKMGFWPVFSVVVGSQVGSGILMSPASLAPYGALGLWGWFFSALGAMSLSLVFATLCARMPKTGGPHVYAGEAFGETAGFFTGWTYWIVSWVSTTTVIVTSVGYLSPILPFKGAMSYFVLQVILLWSIVLVNLRGVGAAGRAEFFLGALKAIPLLFLPLCALYYFDGHNFMNLPKSNSGGIFPSLGKVILLTFWGFIGLETATTPAGSVESPHRTIPKAIFWGTLFVSLLYILNYLGISGYLPHDVLSESKAPYVDATAKLFGGSWHILISVIASALCVGTLNAWVLSSGQVALGLGQDEFLPSVFKRQNQHGAPYWSIILSSVGLVPLLALTANEKLSEQISNVIDFSVVAFLFVYLICTLSLVKLLIRERRAIRIWHWSYTLIALAFSLWVIGQSSLKTIFISSLFVLSGLPIYIFWFKRKNKNTDYKARPARER